MTVLGLRCSNSGYSYVILEGTQKSPSLLDHGTIDAPKGFQTGPRLGWLRQEIMDMCKKHGVRAICMKGAEGLASRNAAFVERIEMEATVFVAANELGIRRVVKKVKNTLAKDLGQKGKAKYLAAIDYSLMQGFDDLEDKEQEAALAAWSHLG